MGETVDTFLAQGPRLLDAMHRAIDADSAEDLGQPAAALSGTAGTLGAVQLAALSAQIVELARRGAVHEAAARMSDLELAWSDSVDAFEAAREQDWDVG